VGKAKPFQWLKQGIFLGGMLPLAILLFRYMSGVMTDPAAETLNQFGMLALLCLLSSLACTPMRLLFGWTWPLRVRKMLGLLSFFYAFMHFSLYFIVSQEANLAVVFEDLAKRPFILIGFSAFLILIPLAITSTNRRIARLGAARWQKLHRLVYAAGILGAVHFFMRVKLDVVEPLIYGGVLAFLLGVRLIAWLKPKPSARPAAN